MDHFLFIFILVPYFLMQSPYFSPSMDCYLLEVKLRIVILLDNLAFGLLYFRLQNENMINDDRRWTLSDAIRSGLGRICWC